MQFSIKNTSEFIASSLGKAAIGLAIASTCGIPTATIPAVVATAFFINLVSEKILNEIKTYFNSATHPTNLSKFHIVVSTLILANPKLLQMIISGAFPLTTPTYLTLLAFNILSDLIYKLTVNGMNVIVDDKISRNLLH